ncbi:MAG: hypothetical protein IKZ07_07625 [Akkermansia sp.]|nr:hypothetical protein [Akkermansia sp.]
MTKALAMFRCICSIIALLACTVQGYDFVRYCNPATQYLHDAAQQYSRAAEPPTAAGGGAVAATEVGQLLLQHLALGFALPGDWFTNADGSVVVLLSEPGCGSVIREFKVYRLQSGHYHHIGTYRVLSRAYRWQPAATCFDTMGAGGMSLRFLSPQGQSIDCRFDFSRSTQIYRVAPAHAPITPAEERGACPHS